MTVDSSPNLHRPSFAPSHRLAGRLTTARRRLFVGRGAELELFRQALLAEEPPFAVLYLFGPGGVGKTTLLWEYLHIAEAQGRVVYRLDGREIDASPQGLLFALSQAIDPEAPPLSLTTLVDLPPAVLILDTYERLAALDNWLREVFLPALPSHLLVVIAGRQPPLSAWLTDSAWRELARIVSLRNLRPEESRQLLSRQGVPERMQASLLEATYGHPLALVLLADWLALNPSSAPGDLRQTPDVVRLLAERFVQDAPSSLHRQALEICAHVRVTTEALLAAVLGPDEAHDLFRWLQNLSFIEQGSQGLFPHDLVREVVEADLRWRNPEAYRQMHHQVRLYLRQRYNESQGVEQQHAFLDTLYMHQYSLMRSRYELKAAGDASIEPAVSGDHPAILQMIERHEGGESATVAAYWLERQPGAFEVFRAAGHPIIGFVAHLLLHTVTAEDEQIDPAMGTLWRYVRSRHPLRPGECILVTRFWMGQETYQDVFIHTLVATSAVRHWLTTPNLAWSFPCMANPDYWAEMFAYLNFHRASEADFTLGGRCFGVFTHDWRVEPQSVWLDILAERELQGEFRSEQIDATPTPELLVLSQPEFAEAVRQALRDYTRSDALATNPLLRSRLLVEPNRPAPTPADLQELLERAVQTLKGNPKDEKLYSALCRTYLHPAPSQEAAAELLGLPFSTYRYHLSKGIQRVTDWLWQRELYGLDA